MNFSISELPDKFDEKDFYNLLNADFDMFEDNVNPDTQIRLHPVSPDKSSVEGIWVVSPENPKTKPARRSLDSSSTNTASSWIENDRKRSAYQLNDLDLFPSPKKRRSNDIISEEATPNKPVVSAVKSQASSPLKSSIASQSSDIRRHFTMDKTDKKLAKCNYCEKSYKHSGNTTNLATHLRCKHPDVLPVSNETKKLSNTNFKAKSGTLDNMVEKIKSYKDGGHLAANLTDEILRMIVKCKLPIMTVNKAGFRRLIKFLAPHYTVPDRKTFKRLIQKKYQLLKQKFIERRIKKALSYCVTCDNWTDNKSQTFLGVTLHLLTPELEVVNANIGVFPMDKSHTAENLAECLNKVFDEFAVEKEKILSIITDSASNIKACVAKVVGAAKWVGCFAHTESHFVPDVFAEVKNKKKEDGVDGASNQKKEVNKTESEQQKKDEKNIEFISEIIDKIRKICAKIRRSGNASDYLKTKQIELGVEEGNCLRFKMDMDVRWNSTLFMIDRYLLLHQYVYDAIKKMLPNNRPAQITPMELDVIKDIVPLMKMVEWGITSVSGESYTTASMVIPIAMIMRSEIEKYTPETSYGKSFQEKLLKSIDKRCDKLEDCIPLVLATFLDPRFKKSFFKKPMTVVIVKNMLNSMINKNLKAKNENQKISNTPVKTIPETNLWSKHKEFVSCNNRKIPGSNNTRQNTEIEGYLQLNCLNFEDDPMEAWKLLKNTFPSLYEIAIRYISILGSSVPSERLFSLAGKHVTDDRNRILGNYLNELLFLHSLPDEYWV